MKIKLAGGKVGGSVRTPREDPNTLRSKAYVRLVDLISEGPTKGFVGPSGIDLVDCILSDLGQPDIVGGALSYDNARFIKDGFGVVTGVKAGSFISPIVGASSGYPLPLTLPLETPEIEAIIEGDGEGAKITVHVLSSGVDQRGVVYGIKLVSGGSGYTTVKVSIPPSVGQGIYLDDIPLQRSDNLAFNFQDVRLVYRLGGALQEPMTGFEQVEEVVDGAEKYPIAKADSIAGAPGYTVVLTNKNYDRALLDIELREGFYYTDLETGDIKEISGENAVRVQITQQYKGDGDVTYGSTEYPFGDEFYTLSGKTMSPYVRTIEGTLRKNPSSNTHSWKINIRRLSEDDSTFDNPSSRRTSFGLGRITGITDEKLRYPNSTLVGIEINAEQFSRIPVRSYNKRFLIIQVPSNYFPPSSVRPDGTIRQFAEYNRRVNEDGSVEAVYENGTLVEQVWDGTFYDSWSNNPAWVFYAVCTHSRYGLGHWLPGANKWNLYKIARYCDEIVYSGYYNGGFAFPEPRFTCTLYVQSEVEAFKFLSDLAGCFRAAVYWSGGQLFPVQDSPKSISHIFTRANVVDGMFVYSSTARRARHNVATVFFNDPEDSYKLKPVVVEDVDGIRRYGRNEISMTRFACTSRGEARRFAEWILKTELANADVVNFRVASIGGMLTPGMIIGVLDETRSRASYQGRIADIGTDDSGRSVVTLDRRIPDDQLPEILQNNQYRFFCTNPTEFKLPSEVSSVEDLDDVLRAQLTPEFSVFSFGLDGFSRTTLILNGKLPDSVLPGQVWGLKNPLLNPQQFRILGIEEIKPTVYEISAVEYHVQIFATIDQGVPYSEDPITYDVSGWKRPEPVKSIFLYVNSKEEQGLLVYTLTASWEPSTPAYVKEYQVYLRKGLGNYKLITATSATSVDFRLEEPDNYCVKVFVVGVGNVKSAATEACTVVGTISGEN